MILFRADAVIAQSIHVNPVNNYIAFANESTHGMLIAHRILEGFNQEVNAYVDLQSNKLNFYGNKDLPKNLFTDPEKWFYDISPNNWYHIATTNNWQSPTKKDLDNIILEMRNICQSVNDIRFELESYIKENDLHQTKHQGEIFSMLNYCASLYLSLIHI